MNAIEKEATMIGRTGRTILTRTTYKNTLKIMIHWFDGTSSVEVRKIKLQT